MLGKLFSEEVEQIDTGPTEALIAAGRRVCKWYDSPYCRKCCRVFSYILYRFEINLRSATILGVIGAGGIGTPLILR